jgi:CubicO group peptidase (beta-lactamase class C family)
MANLQPVKTNATFDGSLYPIEGFADPRFARVVEGFIENFSEGLETGACTAIVHKGETVVDLWGGFKDRLKTKPWEKHTITNLMSIAKAITATCFFLLVERGLADPNDPVSKYWPEFAQNGKKDIPIRWVMDHRAGIPVLDPSPPPGTIYDWDAMCAAIARQAPMFPPGEKCAYHVFNQGFIVGELVRRISGMSIGSFFRKEFADSMGIEYWIGLTPEEMMLCADYIVHPDFVEFVTSKPETKEGIAWAQLHRNEDFNSREFRAAEIPSAGAHGNARGVARFFGMLANGGVWEGKRYIKPETIARMTTEQHYTAQELMPLQYHQAFGMILSSPPNVPMGPNPKAFGHHGAGGCIGLADPAAHISFGYGMNEMAMGLPNGERAQKLIRAMFESL